MKALRTARPTLLVSINIIGVSLANFLVRDQTQASRYFHGWSAVHQRLFALDLDEVDDAVVGRSPDTAGQAELVGLVDAAVATFREMVDLVDVDDLPGRWPSTTRVDRRRCVADHEHGGNRSEADPALEPSTGSATC